MTIYQKFMACAYAVVWLLAAYAFHQSSSAATEKSESYGQPAHILKKAHKK